MKSDMNYLERTGWARYLAELWLGRELLGFLVWKEVKVQFAQTALGLAWVLRPIMNVIVMTFIFGRLAKLPSDGQPYLLFALAGMLPWSYFSAVTSKSAMSLLGNTALITKIYFPRSYLPLSMVLAGLIEFAVTLTLFVVLSGLGYGVWPAIDLPVLLLAFAIGRSIPVGLGAWAIGWLENLKPFSKYSKTFEVIGGIALIAAGLYMLNAYFFIIPSLAA